MEPRYKIYHIITDHSLLKDQIVLKEAEMSDGINLFISVEQAETEMKELKSKDFECTILPVYNL